MQNLGVLRGFQRSAALALQNNELVGGWCWDPVDPNESDWAGLIWHHGEVFDVEPLINKDNDLDVDVVLGMNNLGSLITQTNSAGDVVTAVFSPIESPDADITGDCEINVFDLIALLDNWSMTDSFADIDDSGVVNVTDLLLLLSNWGS